MANANYVRFIRGTPTAWDNLKNKDPDVLYFISEKDADSGYLYLGDKLISGGGGSGVDATILGRIIALEKKEDVDTDTNHLKDLLDVSLSSKITSGSSLVYDGDQKKWVDKVVSGGDEVDVGAHDLSELTDVSLGLDISDGSVLLFDASTGLWTNKVLNIPEEAKVMTGASEYTNGTSGLVPKPIAGKQNLFLRGDGNWANPNEDLDVRFSTLYGIDSETKSIREIAADEVSKISGSNIPEKYNTIEKIATWILENGTSLDGAEGQKRLEALEKATFGEDGTSNTDGLVKNVQTLNDLIYGYDHVTDMYKGLKPIVTQLDIDVGDLQSVVSDLQSNYGSISTTVNDLNSRLTWKKY